jgi:putative ABC transport system permease protein
LFLSYTIRNLLARKRVVIPTTVAVVVTVAATTVVLGMYEGMSRAVRLAGRAENAVILREGAESDAQSSISIETLEKIKVLPGIRTIDGIAQISPELVITVRSKDSNGKLKSNVVRGVDPVAFQVHNGVRIVRGAMPERSYPGLLAGERKANLRPDLRVGREVWPVAGSFSAGGTIFESEYWAERSALMTVQKRTTISAVFVTLEDPSRVLEFAAEVERIRGESLVAMAEPAYFERLTRSTEIFFKAMLAVIALITLDAVFAGTNTMYALFLGRMRELATLFSIGYTRGLERS